MNLERKVEIAKMAVRSIADHDDEPLERVKAALGAVKDFADASLDPAQQRRAKKEASARAEEAAKNKHATVSNAVTLQRVTAGPVTTEDLGPITLLPKEALVVNEAGTPFVYTANGEVKAAGSALGVDPKTNDFRLSGVSATPIMTADNAALATIFLCQYKGNRIALWDGANWQLCVPSAEVSLAVTGRTTDLPFDVFAFLNAGVVTLEFLDWTNATTRATGLTRQDGVWTKTGAATRNS